MEQLETIRQAQQTQDFVVPKVWADFARMTLIRSAGKIVHFCPYSYQEQLVNLMLERSVCVVKSRQLGVSETITSFMLWQACLNPGYLGVVFSRTQTDTSLLARRVKRMISGLGLKTATENLGDIEILGRGRILFKNSKPDAARGLESVCDVFFDEFSYVDEAKLLFDAVTPAQQMLGDEARTFVVSTPNRKDNLYWELLSGGNGTRNIETICERASKGDAEAFQYWVDSGGWFKVVCHWKCHPLFGKNPNFLQEVHERQKLDWQTIEREYNLSFQESAEAVFSSDIVRKGSIGQLEASRQEGASYYIGLDTSTTGGDYTVATVLKEFNNVYSVVALYRKRQETSEYHLYQVGELIERYHPETVAIETTGGTGVLYLENLSRQYKWTPFEAIRTTGDSKPAMVAALQLALEKQILHYQANSPIIDELLSFRREGSKLEAPSGKHDDCVMSLCFALTVTPFGKGKKSKIDFTKIKRDA